MDLDPQHVGVAPGQELQAGNQTRSDPVTDQVREPLFEIERFAHPPDVVRRILHADQQRASRRIGEGRDGPQRRGGGRQIALELEDFSFGTLEGGEEIHSSEKYSEAAEAARLQGSGFRASLHAHPAGSASRLTTRRIIRSLAASV